MTQEKQIEYTQLFNQPFSLIASHRGKGFLMTTLLIMSPCSYTRA